MIPGSLNDVWKRDDMTKINKRAPTAGIAGVRYFAKKGQLQNVNKHQNVDKF